MRTSIPTVADIKAANFFANKIIFEDRAAHNWYRFVLSYPPHLVRTYLQRFGLGGKQLVLDPFCGTGTTLVECKKSGISSVGVESHPMAAFASQTKVEWDIEADEFMTHATRIGIRTTKQLSREQISDCEFNRVLGLSRLRSLSDELLDLLLTDSISPLPLHKVLSLLDCIKAEPDSPFANHELLALASAVVNSISNLHFGPEVGVTAPKYDSPVVAPWLEKISSMQRDLSSSFSSLTPWLYRRE
jgi:hypothetical protein